MDTPLTKPCKSCGVEKPLSEFYKHKSSKYGVTAICKICRCLQDGFTPLVWREVILDGMKRCTACKKVIPATPEHFHRTPKRDGLISICKPCRNSKRKQEYAEKPELRKQAVERAKSRWIKNPEGARASSRTSVLNYQSRKRNAPGKHTTKDMQLQREKQGHRCFWCSVDVSTKYHVDHYTPLNRGGSNWPDNIVISCPHCNDSKSDKLPYSEWTPPNPLFKRQD